MSWLIALFVNIFILSKFLFFDDELFVILVFLLFIGIIFFYINELSFNWYKESILLLFRMMYSFFSLSLVINKMMQSLFFFLYQRFLWVYKDFFLLFKKFYLNFLHIYVWERFFFSFDWLLMKKLYYLSLSDFILKLLSKK